MIKKGDIVMVEMPEEIKNDIPLIATVLDVDDGLAEIELIGEYVENSHIITIGLNKLEKLS